MAPYRLSFERTHSETAHLLPEEQEKLLIPLGTITEGAVNSFTTLTNTELPFQDILFPDGMTRTADEGNYGLALGGGFTQAFRKEYLDTMLGTYQAFRSTLAQNYHNYCTGVIKLAKAHGYASALEASLTGNCVIR